ncbi:MAG TPA: SRPBCC family protein [Patescibacteria group bacterium]|nr:SRPBCC family protein [Patescibacteria group bacterium]
MRLRTIATIAVTGVAGAFLVDRWIGDLIARGEGPDPVMKMAITIDAPIDEVWEVVSDIERQPLWMAEMKAVRLRSPGPVGVGTRGDADVRIFLVGIVDAVEVDVYDPPTRFGIRHVGTYSGGGRMTLEAIDARRTLVRWDERLVPPVFPHLGQLLQKPILGAIFQSDLERLREIVESEHAEAMAGAGADGG